MQGFINVFKPTNMSSAKAVAKIKHKFHIDKIGHMGTLDPLACGILPVAVGKATRMFDYFLNKKKTYETIIKFGEQTDSLDLDGKIIKTSDNIPTVNQIKSILPSFIGVQEQMPPMFSAKSVNGQKAYKLARAGETVELNKKEITIYNLNLLEQIDNFSFKFEIECSSGTYIRCIARDLGEKLKSCAMLTYLERTKSDNFNKSNCVLLDNLLNSDINNYLISVENVFKNFDILEVNQEEFTKLKNGLNIQKSVNYENFFIKSNADLLGVGMCENNQIKVKTYLLDK